MGSEGIILSIVVISHNQCELLRRCLKSILSQRMSFPYEVIVSDDRSTDGTRTMLESEFANCVTITYCDSDECQPSMTSERAGYNRINGLKYASGKYLIHVDGDDFYTSDDIFQLLVDTLEKHPECNLCFQNYKILKDGCNLETASIGCPSKLFTNGPVLTPTDFIKFFPYIHNSACCMRRPSTIPFELLKPYRYDDVDITYQYIGYGNVALVDRTDFVYVKYDFQTASSFSPNDQRVQWATYLTSARIAPQFTYWLLKNNLSDLLHLIRLAQKKTLVSINTIEYIKKLDVRLLKLFNNRYSLLSRIYLRFLELYVLILKHYGLKGVFFYKVLSFLAIG